MLFVPLLFRWKYETQRGGEPFPWLHSCQGVWLESVLLHRKLWSPSYLWDWEDGFRGWSGGTFRSRVCRAFQLEVAAFSQWQHNCKVLRSISFFLWGLIVGECWIRSPFQKGEIKSIMTYNRVPSYFFVFALLLFFQSGCSATRCKILGKCSHRMGKNNPGTGLWWESHAHWVFYVAAETQK